MTRRLCLVTGASAGIGAAFARTYAAHGYDVALTGRRSDRLDALAETIRLRYGVETLSLPVDLAEAGACDEILKSLQSHGREVDALVNNAGYAVPGAFAATRWPDQAAFLQVLVTAVAEMTHKVLPGMIERKFGRIVNVASIAGLVPGAPSSTLYGAAKGFVVKFSQSLHLENQATGVHVSALCPGLTYSEFHEAAGMTDMVSQIPAWLWMGADEVAAQGYEAAEANRAVCVPGSPNKALAVLAKLIPDEWALAVMAHQARRLGRL